MASGSVSYKWYIRLPFGITDYFQMDILGWKNNVAQEQGGFLHFVSRKCKYLYSLCGNAYGNILWPFRSRKKIYFDAFGTM